MLPAPERPAARPVEPERTVAGPAPCGKRLRGRPPRAGPSQVRETAVMRTLLRDGRIHSPEAPDGSALVIEDGGIAWIGDEDGAQSLAEAPEAVDAIVDLAGALVTPAFVDARVQMTDIGLRLLAVDLGGAASLREALDALERDARSSRGRPVLGVGWSAAAWPEGRGPSAAELDRAGYGGTVLVIDRDGAGAASTPVLRAAGLPGDAAPLSGGALAAATTAVKAMLLPGSRASAQRAALEAAAAAGVGSVHEFAGPSDTGAADLAALLAAAGEPGAPLVLAYWAQLGAVEAARELGAVGLADTLGDGAAPVEAAARAEHLLACAQAGLQSAFDAATADALDSVLESFALAAARTDPIRIHGAGHRIERAAAIADPARLAARGLLVSAQPGRIADLAAVSAAGVPLAFGSDAPYDRSAVAPFDPWGTIQAAVYGADSAAGGGRAARGISPRAAFTAHTRGGWRAVRGEHDGSGVIRAGAPAHLAIWAAGGLGMDAVDARVSRWSTDEQANLPGLPELQPGVQLPRCLRTIVAGRIAFDAGELD